MTPSGSLKATRSPTDTPEANSSDTSRVIGMGQRVPSARRMSEQTGS